MLYLPRTGRLPPWMVGQTLSHYRLLERVGQGGMAEVYRAVDENLDRVVAIKVMHKHLASELESRLRFAREAKAVARLKHDNILEVYAYSDEGSQEAYLVTEFIDGPTLRAVLLSHLPRFPEVAAMIGVEIASALLTAHRMGIVHRDVKPENIMVRPPGTLVLCDFGIARIVDKDNVTSTGQLLGSPAYIAPEHIKGQPQDGRSDLFSLGVILYEALTGSLPFAGRNAHETLTKITSGQFAPLCEQAPLCSRELAAIIERLLATDPGDRPLDASVLVGELTAVLRDTGIDDPAAELTTYLRDPEAWESVHSKRFVAHLTRTGQALQRQGRTAAALSAWARAQLVAPDDAELASLVNSVSRRHRTRRQLAYVGSATLGVLAVVAGGKVLHDRNSRPPAPSQLHDSQPSPEPTPGPPQMSLANVPAAQPEASTQTPPLAIPAPPTASAGAPSPLPSPTATELEPRGSRPKKPHPGPHTEKPEPLRTVRLEPWPKAVVVTHNGKRLGEYGTDVRDVQLRPGQNEFLFESPACYSEKVVLPGDSRVPEVRVRLRWKPALLQLRVHSSKLTGDSTAAEVVVVVDGHVIGRAGQVMALPVRSDDGQQTVQLQVSAAGHQTVTRAVTVRANQLSTLDINLPTQ